MMQEGNRVKIPKPSLQAAALDAKQKRTAPESVETARKKGSAGKTQSNTAFAQLQLAMEKLQLLVAKMQNRSPKEQSRMAKVLNLVLRRFGGK